jgi:hypothetical protein
MVGQGPPYRLRFAALVAGNVWDRGPGYARYYVP